MSLPPKPPANDLPIDPKRLAEFFAEVEDQEDEDHSTDRRPTPPRWKELKHKVRTAATLRRAVNPEYPLEKIGTFEALGVLGMGGYGCVFRVRDPELDRVVALKLCDTRKPGAAELLKSEARILAKLSHPNIITVHEIGEHEGDLFFIMELIEGSDMHRYAIQTDDPPSWRELVDIYCVVGRALAAAHEANIVHGDLKPANILIDAETKKPWIADFGLGRVMDGSADEALLGTEHYMAPEQLRGGPSTALSDQYSFCVAMWHCLEGHAPFGGDNIEGLLFDIETECPAKFRDGVPERLRAVLTKGLACEASRRYPDMHALVEAIEQIRGPVPVELVPGAQSSPSPGGGGAKGRGAAFGFALLVGLAGVSAEFILFQRSSLSATTTSTSTPDPEFPKAPPPDLRKSGEEGFKSADAALKNGKHRVCYNKWLAAHTDLNQVEPYRAGALSIKLADHFAELVPGRVSAAWMAIGAAESFELAPHWERATKARERAAELCTDAGLADLAAEQLRCAASYEVEKKRCAKKVKD